MRHFKSKHPGLKWSTVNDWKRSIQVKTSKSYCAGQVEPIETPESKKRGRPALLSIAEG